LSDEAQYSSDELWCHITQLESLKRAHALPPLSFRGKGTPSLHKVGVSLHWDKVCGCVFPEEPDPILYNMTYADR